MAFLLDGPSIPGIMSPNCDYLRAGNRDDGKRPFTKPSPATASTTLAPVLGDGTAVEWWFAFKPTTVTGQLGVKIGDPKKMSLLLSFFIYFIYLFIYIYKYKIY